VVNPELVEVAKDDVAGTIFRQVYPVIADLQVVLLQLLAALFHFDQDALGPNEVGEFGGVVPAQAVFQLAADLDQARVSERTEQVVEKDLRFALFVAFEIRGELNEFLEFGCDRLHGQRDLVGIWNGDWRGSLRVYW